MSYKKTEWVDHIKDIDTGEMIQQGTPISARNLNNIEEGIANNNVVSKNNKADITSVAVEVAVLKQASLNNMVNNVFFENFDSLDSVDVSGGIYDKVEKRLYV